MLLESNTELEREVTTDHAHLYTPDNIQQSSCLMFFFTLFFLLQVEGLKKELKEGEEEFQKLVNYIKQYQEETKEKVWVYSYSVDYMTKGLQCFVVVSRLMFSRLTL